MDRIDKLKIIKEILFFKYSATEILDELISYMEEQAVEANKLIIEKGTFGNEMYIILEGKVKVHDGDQLIAKIGSGQVFGELAALSPQIRIASVSAIENSLLLKISHEILYSIMKRNAGFAQGIIEFLCERTRNMSMLQKQLLQQQNLAAIGLLSSGLAHELKNPLNFVINFTQVGHELIKELLEMPFEDSAANNNDQFRSGLNELSDLMTKIILHGKRADGIIKSLLLHAHQCGENSEVCSLSALLDEACSFALEIFCKQKQFKINIIKNYDHAVKPLEIFPKELTQVFINIIDNACYSMYKKQKDDELFLPILEITLQDFTDEVQITIKDNGEGISQKHLNHLFQPLFTTKPPGEGTGFGLSVSYEIITQQHAGKIEVHTDHCSYTEFKISLPKK